MTWLPPAFSLLAGLLIIAIQGALPSPLDTWALRTAITVMAAWVTVEFWLSLKFNGRLMRALAFTATTNTLALAWFVVLQAPVALGYGMPVWARWMAAHTAIIWVPYALAVLNLVVELRLGRRR